MMIVGLTGGIGSGKSTVAKMFKLLDVAVYDSDKEAKSLMVSSKILRKAIIGLLGERAYSEEKLNKTYISSQVFNKPELLQKLNQIVHPAVKAHFLDWTKNQNSPYVIQETALIFENNSQSSYDVVIIVTAPEHHRIQRVVNRDGVDEKQVLKRMANQLDDTEKIVLADYIIENLDLNTTKERVFEIHQELLNQSTVS